MRFLMQAVNRLLPDPPPALVFELGDGFLLGARRSAQSIEASAERALPSGAGAASGPGPDPALVNAINGILRELAPLSSPQAAVLLPDREARLAVFDLDRMPRRARDLRRAVEERFGQSLPFSVRDAHIAYRTQGSARRPSVLAAAASARIVRRCEAAFEAAGLVPGHVGLATAAALNLIEAGPMTVLAKLGGGALTIVATEEGQVRLVRRIALAIPDAADPASAVDEILADLFPTIVYIGENLRTPVWRLLLCGFGDLLQPATEIMQSEVQVPVETLSGASRDGASMGAGLLGYVHG